jgi:serine/threonine protein kinase
MLQLVVDNVKHILRCVLRGVEYLHGNNIVHNDIKPSNVLVNLSPGCRCGSPIVCSCQQSFEVVITDFDSSVSVKEPEKNKRKWSLVGTGGYRAPERYLQSLEFDETSPLQWKKGDIWSFGALVLKMFLSHYGPGSQRQVAILYLWRYATFPWNLEDKMADKVLQQKLIKMVYPNWPQVWKLASDCMKVSPMERPNAAELANHPFFSS